MNLVSARNLRISYGNNVAVSDVSFTIRNGEATAIIGESGSGKTTLAMALGGFLNPLHATVTADSFEFQGADLMARESGYLPRRTPGISMIFQDAMTSLDPVWTIGQQLVAVQQQVSKVSKKSAFVIACEKLLAIGLRDPERVMKLRPHELSGGMRQRVMTAIALASDPALLIADEPTSALDASMAGEAMRLMVDSAKSKGSAVVVISHDLQLCRRYTDFVIVMYRGKIVEEIPTNQLEHAQHPYTRGLLSCVPSLETAGVETLPLLEDFFDGRVAQEKVLA